MPTRVKICGVTRLEDAELAAELGAAALGFNFYAPSPRYIEPAAARAIVQNLPPFVTAVGVFADETDAGRVATVARAAGVAAIQLHGPRFPAAPDADDALGSYPLIWAVAVREDFRPERLRSDLKFRGASAFLLDGYDPNLRGGTGKVFDWSLAIEVRKLARVILAGGLTPDNVAEAIRRVRPFAVDVASGVESAPGKKDPAKLRAFFDAVSEADWSLRRS